MTKEPEYRPCYRWESPYEWLQHKIAASQGDAKALTELLNTITPTMSLDDIQDLFQSDMDDDGFFTELHTRHEGIVEVCAHRIAYRYWDFEPRELTDDFKEMLENDAEERAQECVEQGYISGQLCSIDPDTEEEIFGWWEIED